ncbi:Lrp/AsnC family transcriptional regulator [Caulobacter sp. RL271]|jgi:Lrp/AsnC family leucine-responsive transcriptional regulator|uniref:Lrp/AsnC family transcriptional regulator n=1 Tax=Caulobacter segnis TaxID=88688 RepID=A0ABY4ZQ42_9CAUL|nr:Lrp/AsnC family transcriptional regulator [Caulobacter segnis]USQ94897.1 Lrp/AsnC family transcriptional regulator [Caulobacter segnis]
MPPLSRIDLSILRVLEADARISFADLAERVGLSKSPCWTRVQALEKQGVITGYHARLAAKAVGKGLTVYAQATVDFARAEAFEAAVLKHPAITDCHSTAGAGDYLLRVVAADVEDLDHLLRKDLSQLPGVQRFTTTVCMKAIKEGGGLMG